MNNNTVQYNTIPIQYKTSYFPRYKSNPLSIFPLGIENFVQFILFLVGKDLVLQKVVGNPALHVSNSRELKLGPIGVTVGTGLGQPVREHDVFFSDPEKERFWDKTKDIAKRENGLQQIGGPL